MRRREERVVEVVGGIVSHAEFFHDAAGAEIGGDSEGDERGESESAGGVADNFAGGFGAEAVSPVSGREPPADFDAGSEMRGEGGDGEADVADEGVGGAEFEGAEAEAMALEVGLDAVGEGVAFVGGEGRGEELHDERIGV